MIERGIIEADTRHTTRRIKTAMQGSAIRALVELITNADDSYVRLEEQSKPCNGVIEIIYKKDGYCGLFAVRDYAEGMSIEEVRDSFKKYGAATSGMKGGKGVRGYFGQGAKDALASMLDGKICTFKDGKFVECKLFIKDEKPWYEINGPITANSDPRRAHKIENNGTVAYFKVDPEKSGRVPQFSTVHQELANNYLLRKIMINPQRKIFLLDEGDSQSKPRQLHYKMSEGKEILADDFSISFGDYGTFSIHISIFRAEKELTQSGDDRDGGLLLVDDKNAVLGISMFKYDNEPLAAHFFGEVRIERFRELLNKEEAVLSEERDGIISRHPFCKELIVEIEKRLESKIGEEKLRKQKETQSKIDREEATRYKKAFSMLNEIAEKEAEVITNLGTNPTDQLEDPPDGFCLYPSSANITAGKRYAFELRLNTKVVRHGTTIKVTSSNQKIRILTPEVKLSSEDGSGILRKYITVEGIEPSSVINCPRQEFM